MPKYSYIGRKPTGEKEAGVIEGATQDEVVFQLQKNGLILTSIIPFDVGKAETKKQVQEAVVIGNPKTNLRDHVVRVVGIRACRHHRGIAHFAGAGDRVPVEGGVEVLAVG